MNSGSKGIPDFGTKDKQSRVNWTWTLKIRPLLFRDKGKLHDDFTMDLYLT